MMRARERLHEAAPPADPSRAWIAEVVWSEEAGEARFRVWSRPADGGETVEVAASGTLAWPPADAESVQRLGRAVERLEAALIASGWTPQPPGRAWYAKRFAWAPAQEPAAAEAPPAERAGRFKRGVEWPDGTEDLWRCEIRWRPGYVTSRFEAVAFEPGRHRGATVGHSEPFKWLLMGDPSPEDAAHVDEVRRTGERLVAAGWEPAGRGRHWYALRFLWRHDDPPQPLSEPEPESEDS